MKKKGQVGEKVYMESTEIVQDVLHHPLDCAAVCDFLAAVR